MRRRSTLDILQLCLFGMMLWLPSVAATASEPDRARDGLLGPVREVLIKSSSGTIQRTYNRAGTLLESVNRVAPPADEPDMQERIEKYVFVYEPGGRLTREILVDEDGQQYVSKLYAFDATGKRIAEAAYHMCGTFSSLHMYTYDVLGRLREEQWYRYRSLMRDVYQYDQRGILAARTQYKNGIVQSTIRYQLDQLGRIIEEVESLADGTRIKSVHYQYDQAGNPALQEVVNFRDPSQSTKSVIVYEYDTVGNWTRKTVRRAAASVGADSKPTSEASEHVERLITYY